MHMKKNRPLFQQALLSSLVIAFTRRIALIFFAGILAGPAFGASNLYWAGTGSSASAPASGPWDASTLDWSATSTGSPTTAWANGDNAVFGGVDGAYGVSVNTGRSIAGILFTNSGYTLSNTASPETITVSTSGTLTTPNIFVDTDKTADIGTNITITDNGTLILDGNGTLNLDNGSKCAETTSSTFGIYSNLTVNLMTGAIFQDTYVGTSTSGGIGIAASGGTAALIVNGGTATFASTNQALGISGGINANGALTINAGSFIQTSPLNNKLTTLASGSGSTATINLNGGLLGLAGITNGQGTGIFNFNGGTLKAMSTIHQTLFWTPGTIVNVKSGGAVIDNNGLPAVTIGSALVTGTGTDGGLIVTNSGTGGSLILTNANTYNGPTVIKSGAYLATTTWSTGGGSYNVNDGATLEVQVSVYGGDLAMSSLTLGTSGNLTNVFTLGANANGTTPAVAVSGALTLNGTVTVNVNGSGLTGPNTYVLTDFGSVTGSGSFIAGTLPSVVGYNATLVETATQLQLVYIAVPPTIKWAAGNGNWDTTTANWQPLAGGSPVDYAEATPVLFDDSASGTGPITVTLTGNHTPNVVTNNSTMNYTFAGSYNLTGAPLIKSGSSTLTIDNGSGNGFPSVTLNSGTLQIGNNDTNGSLGSGSVADNAVLAFDRTDSPTFANVISGSGGVTQNGSGTVTLSNTNTYSGSTTVSAGDLVTTTLSTGAGAYSVLNAATLSVQVGKAATSLTNSSLTLGATPSDVLTNVFALGANGSTTVPAVQVQGALTLNGTVTVNVTGSLASGTYPLMSYNSLTGSGSFVLGTVPAVATNTVQLQVSGTQLQLVYTPFSTLTWDSGNTNDGSTIDAGNGTWDKNPSNLVWNFNGLNMGWQDIVPAIFAGADGNWMINLATNVSPGSITINNSGYSFSAATPEMIILPQGSGSSPNWVMNSPGTVTIGNNVTVEATSTYVMYGTAGGTVNITSGAAIVETNSSTFDIGGSVTYNLEAGGAMTATYVGTSTTGGFQVGAIVGDDTILNVNGGSVSLAGTNNMGIGIGAAIASSGTLTINSGTVSMAASNTVRVMNVASAAGSTGIVNLNGGVLAVTTITNALGTATVNFNGGTLEAVNGSFGPVFLAPFQPGSTVNVLSGGALINNNGFNITIAQPLANGGGPDGGLTSLGSGSLTLTGANTYNGNTVINGGRLALSGSASINTASIVVAGGATFDVSALGSVTLASGQVLSNSTSTATLDGSVNASAGQLSLTYVSGAPSFAVTNGTLTLPTGTLQINNTGAALTAGNHELIAANNGGLVTGALPSFTIGGSGLSAGATASLQITGGSLYLVVSGGTPPPVPHITSISVTGTTLNITATNGADNGVYELLESTNLTLPLSQWQPVLTNTFNGSGVLDLSTNIVKPNVPDEFYILEQ
jgi:fibronectin-binding autotransporter adhesin